MGNLESGHGVRNTHRSTPLKSTANTFRETAILAQDAMLIRVFKHDVNIVMVSEILEYLFGAVCIVITVLIFTYLRPDILR